MCVLQQHLPVWRHSARTTGSHGHWDASSWSSKISKLKSAHFDFFLLVQIVLGTAGPDGGNLYQFDGGADSFVDFSSDLTVEHSQGFTIAGWITQDPGNDG